MPRPIRVLLASALGLVLGAAVGLTAAPVASANGCVFLNFGGGSGTAEDPIQVSTAAHLTALKNDSRCWGYQLIQTADVDMGGATWTSTIGTSSQAFTGTYNGNGFAISGVTVAPASSDAGLFGRLIGGSIKNLAFTGVVNAAGFSNVGGLVGYNDLGTISNSYATGAVNGDMAVGGLVGNNNGVISNSYATGAVNGSRAVGGLVGLNNRVISNSYATGNATGTSPVGGLVGDGVTATASFRSGTPNAGAGTFATVAEMRSMSTFTAASWDIAAGWSSGVSVWGICADANDGLPFLTVMYRSNPCADTSNSSAGTTLTRTLGLGSAAGCAISALSGPDSSWVQLPSADQCTGAGRTLLGWSTSRAFPVAQARHQRAMGWGAIDEIVDGSRVIFIPAGGFTLLSGDNELHPVWD